MNENIDEQVVRRPHHERDLLCTSRPKYRDGRRLKAVKAYTISNESQYLVIRGLSVVHGAFEGLVVRLREFGNTTEERILVDYPLEDSEKFTQVMLVKFVRIPSARIAKMKLDDLNYLGEILHVCYAPEFESREETKGKLEERRRTVTRRLEKLNGHTAVETTRNGNHAFTQPAISIENNHEYSNFPHYLNNSQYIQNHTALDICRNVNQAANWPITSNTFNNEYSNPPNHPVNKHMHMQNIQNPSHPRLIPRQMNKIVQKLGINATLRSNALTLGDEQGPQLPEHVERKRKTFHRSIMGDESLDDTQQNIRSKIAKLNDDR